MNSSTAANLRYVTNSPTSGFCLVPSTFDARGRAYYVYLVALGGRLVATILTVLHKAIFMLGTSIDNPDLLTEPAV